MSHPDDLDRLVDALDTLAADEPGARRVDAPAASARALADAADAPLASVDRLDDLLHSAAGRDAGDLILVAGEPPILRIHGALQRMSGRALDSDDIESIVLPGLPPHARQAYKTTGIGDGSRRVPGLGRFRINLHRERGRPAAVVRTLPAKVPTLASLDLPPGTERLAHVGRGLVLVGGATGAGKTTTLAAIVNDINRRSARHIVTIEDPIEYEHTNQQSIVQQIEIGIDAPDFPTALRSALRQSPDVIVIGEMRDPETMRIALAAGETGHVVYSTLHTTDVASTIARMADSFPEERQNTIRQEIAAALAAVFVQTLLPRRNGARVAAAELLMVSYGARQHIRRNALQHLHQEMTITRRAGSFTLEECLARLVRNGSVDRQEAAARAGHPDDFEHALGAS